MEFENNEALAQEDTTPGAEASNETNGTQVTDTASQESGEETNGSEGGTATQNTEEEENEEESGLDVRFNHQDVKLSREDAVKFAQMGMKLEKLNPVLSKIDFLASVSNKTREEFIEELFNQYESGIEKNLRESFTGDENILADLIALEKNKHKEAYENMLKRNRTAEEEAEKQAVEAVETRIAGEYTELIKEFPELEGKEFRDLPASVKKAAYSGTALMTAYLLHQHNEQRKAQAAEKATEKQNKASVGSMSGGEGISSADIDFLKGLWGK